MNITRERFKQDYEQKLMSLFTEEIDKASTLDKYLALGSLVKEYSAKNWSKTKKQYSKDGDKQVYYFSMEFLIGRLLQSNLINLGIRDTVKEALAELNVSLDELEETEVDAGLGNGGLGRLAACFIDSIASIGIPGHGNGMRYQYGFFEQKIVNGYQVEIPDNWLKEGNVWETKREDKSVIVKFYGTPKAVQNNGRLNFELENYEAIKAVPYDTPVIGYENNTVNTLRLWSAEPVTNAFNFQIFSKGEYSKAVEYRTSVEAISSVLYPDDSAETGKILRLKQQYFFTSAGIYSILRTFKNSGHSLYDLDKYVAIQINDTHPAVAVAELMRILVDEEEMGWDDAWSVTTGTLAYTNHTILSEALEKWPVQVFNKLLPRIYMIIEEINRRFVGEIYQKHPNDHDRVRRMSIIEGGMVKMAHLAIVGSHSVNGVATLHTEILVNKELRDFSEFYPRKFNNKTNGITHRRWLIQSNEELTSYITKCIGDSWKKRPKDLAQFAELSKDPLVRKRVGEIKLHNKQMLADMVKKDYDIDVDPNSIFDIQVKRLHAYKRQVLNILHIMDLYNRLKDNPDLDISPRTYFFGAKSSPSYHLAKETIKLINTVADKINNDPSIKGKLKVVFLENYRVSLAEKIIKCADISEQISTTTFEASGTGNMKFMMNGALTLGTLDGANVEIHDEVGDENMFVFGMSKDEVLNYLKYGGYSPRHFYNTNSRIKRVLDQLVDGSLGVATTEFRNIHSSLLGRDEYFVLKDFDSYCEAQERIDKVFRDKDKWNEMCIVNIGKSGRFSSDNTITEYSREIWNTSPKEIH
ncbi:glycogen/starch/alpha-glucan phosphorylase [Clostridium cellulovorans]|uniref:Alpha-1,4 glucan phosphorylase n=1 Tax=Clostridium cellulovorans (strain ATCC 35296 / DSM 3052 / OCM 3 / 743B) TaxID=573061 RepID=D9SVB5_CLOC7|nr:glycogen/starch/alpha-glucan phosphorylase [Clostridium cellulovorans]ADL51039.1 glycogen/starch/alpha-glucan phosphorylase [Clostridium cellulovorans 743B]